MTVFLNARAQSGGGGVAPQLAAITATVGASASLATSDLQSFIHGKDVLIATHGFNVNYADGVECLCEWEPLLQLPATAVLVGLLWPGDSDSIYALSYPEEPANAMQSGAMVGQFVDAYFANAASVSFVSHSLGARVVLQAVSTMQRRVRRLILMAGAISDDCLTAEFVSVPAKVDSITVLSSMQDEILQYAFPLGNVAAEILGRDHPWWQSALGRFGPAAPPSNYAPPNRIPDEWNYGHLDYLRTVPPAHTPVPPPASVPESGPIPLKGTAGWQQAWSAAFVSSRFR